MGCTSSKKNEDGEEFASPIPVSPLSPQSPQSPAHGAAFEHCTAPNVLRGRRHGGHSRSPNPHAIAEHQYERRHGRARDSMLSLHSHSSAEESTDRIQANTSFASTVTAGHSSTGSGSGSQPDGEAFERSSSPPSRRRRNRSNTGSSTQKKAPHEDSLRKGSSGSSPPPRTNSDLTARGTGSGPGSPPLENPLLSRGSSVFEGEDNPIQPPVAAHKLPEEAAQHEERFIRNGVAAGRPHSTGLGGSGSGGAGSPEQISRNPSANSLNVFVTAQLSQSDTYPARAPMDATAFASGVVHDVHGQGQGQLPTPMNWSLHGSPPAVPLNPTAGAGGGGGPAPATTASANSSVRTLSPRRASLKPPLSSRRSSTFSSNRHTPVSVTDNTNTTAGVPTLSLPFHLFPTEDTGTPPEVSPYQPPAESELIESPQTNSIGLSTPHGRLYAEIGERTPSPGYAMIEPEEADWWVQAFQETLTPSSRLRLAVGNLELELQPQPPPVVGSDPIAAQQPNITPLRGGSGATPAQAQADPNSPLSPADQKVSQKVCEWFQDLKPKGDQ